MFRASDFSGHLSPKAARVMKILHDESESRDCRNKFFEMRYIDFEMHKHYNVGKQIDELAAKNFIAVKRGSGGKSNKFWINYKKLENFIK